MEKEKVQKLFRVRRIPFIYSNLTPETLPLHQLLSLAVWGLGISHRRPTPIELNRQQAIIRNNPIATAYLNLLFHAASQLAVSTCGRVHLVDEDNLCFIPIQNIAMKIPLDTAKIKEVYLGKGTSSELLVLLEWYGDQWGKYNPVNYITNRLLIEHVFGLAQQHREILNEKYLLLLDRLTQA